MIDLRREGSVFVLTLQAGENRLNRPFLDALNRAGSTDPEKLRTALAATDIPPDQLIVPYLGVKFDANGQNTLVRPILMQVQKGKYCTIYPFELASCEVLYPTPTWADKAKG